MSIFKMTNLLTGEIYIGASRGCDNAEKVKPKHIPKHFKTYDYDDIKFEFIKICNESDELEQKTIAIIDAIKQNEKIINMYYGKFKRNVVEQYIKNYSNLSTKEIYDKLNANEKINKIVDKTRTYYALKYYTDNEIYIGRNKDICIDDKTYENFKDKNICMEILGQGDFYQTFDICLRECIKLYLNNENLLNTIFGRIPKNTVEQIHRFSPHLNTEEIIREISFIKNEINRIYLIIDKNENAYYVGRTNHALYQRLMGHYNDTTALAKSMKKYNLENFIIKELYVCKNLEEARQKEREYTDLYFNKGYKMYNIRTGDVMIRKSSYNIYKLTNLLTNEVIYKYDNFITFVGIESVFIHYPEFISEYKLNGMQNLKLDIYKNQTLDDYSRMIIHSVLHENNKNDIDVLRLEIIKHLCDKPIDEIVPFIQENLSDKQLKQNAKQICGNTRYRFIHVFINEQTKQAQISVNADRLQNVIQSCLFCDKSLLIAKTINYGEFEKMNIEACKEAIKLMWQDYELQTENIGRVKMSWFRKFKANLGHESLERALEIYNMYLTQKKLLFWFQYHDDIHIACCKKTMFGYIYNDFLNPEKIQLHFLGYLKDFNLGDVISSFNQNVICHIKR